VRFRLSYFLLQSRILLLSVGVGTGIATATLGINFAAHLKVIGSVEAGQATAAVGLVVALLVHVKTLQLLLVLLLLLRTVPHARRLVKRAGVAAHLVFKVATAARAPTARIQLRILALAVQMLHLNLVLLLLLLELRVILRADLVHLPRCVALIPATALVFV
jgi:hypothetical protein